MKFSITAVCAAVLLTAAHAETRTFDVAGQDSEGGYYTGTVKVEELPGGGKGGADSFRVTWNTGGGPVVGIGVIESTNPKVMSVGYILNGEAGVAHMIQTRTGASGVWAIDGGDGTGFETWTR
jgi:hypothetical protein